MNSLMREAMRLMKAGDLAGATAAIRKNLGRAPGVAGDASRDDRESAPIEGEFRVLDEGTRAGRHSPRESREGRTPNAETRFIDSVYTNGAGTRQYKLFIPSSYTGQPLPLVAMLHGCTQTPDDFALGTRMNALAEERHCFVLYPAQAQTANTSKCWNWFKASDQQRGRGEPAIIAGLTRDVVQRYGMDSKRVYVAGLSAGGAMAVVMGRAYPDLYAAVGVHSGLPYAAAHDIPSAFAAMNGGGVPADHVTTSGHSSRIVPTIVFHGDQDNTVHPGNGDGVIAQCTSAPVYKETTERNRVPGGHAYTRTLFRDANDCVVVEHWVVHGAGHAWSGGSSRGSYTDPKGPDASREMIRFFYEHTLA